MTPEQQKITDLVLAPIPQEETGMTSFSENLPQDLLDQLDDIKIAFLKSYTSNGFHISKAMRSIGKARTTYNQWLENDPVFNKVIELFRESIIDDLEQSLFKYANEGNAQLLIFALKTQGKRRGYGDTMDITTNGESINKITFTIIPPKHNDELNA